MAFWNRKKKESGAVSIIYGDGFYSIRTPRYDAEKLAKESYCRNVIAFKCIDKIAKAVASVPWFLYKKIAGEDDERILNHPVLELLARPNPIESFPIIMEKLIAFLLINGNSYLERVQLKTGKNTGLVKELYSLRPDKMSIEVDNGIKAYIYGTGIHKKIYPIDPVTGQANILHLKTFHPLDDVFGWPITQSSAQDIDTGNDMSVWNRSLVKNSARPGTLVTIEKSLTTEQYSRIKEQMSKKHSGSDNAGKMMVLEGVGEGKTTITPWGWSPKEMDFNESERNVARRIASAYGVPMQLLGYPEASSYNNMAEANDSFWEDTVNWYIKMVQAELNNWLLHDTTEIYLKASLDDVPALAHKKVNAWKMVDSASFLTINEKRKEAGLDSIAGGDILLVNGSLQPLGAIPDDNFEDEEPLTEDEVAAEEEIAKNLLLESGFCQESIERFLGYNND